MHPYLERLHQDHRNIDRLLGFLEQGIRSLDAGVYVDLQLLTDVLHYFVTCPDTEHHPLEDLIFARLKDIRHATADDIDAIFTEHALMATESRDLHGLLNQLQGGAVLDRKDLVRRLLSFVEIYRRHISAEESALMGAADQALGSRDWQEIEKEFVMGQDPMFGAVLHRQFENLYQAILAETDD